MKQVWDRLRSPLVDIIEWSDASAGAPSPAGDTLAWRFDAGGDPGRSRAIRNGAQLIVREGQWAVFLDEGRIADVFGPGRHTLSTANLPLLTTLLCLPTGFESPFKAEVVFVCTRLFSGLRWGTRHPLLLRDPELGPLRLRGFGSYSLRVSDPAWLVREVSGACGSLSLTSLTDPLRQLIVSRLAAVLGRCGCPVFDLSSRYETLAHDLRLALVEEVQQFGLEIPSLLIEALTLPPEVEAALDQRSTLLVACDSAAGAAPAAEAAPRSAVPCPAVAPASSPPPSAAATPSPATLMSPATAAPRALPRRAPPPPPPLASMPPSPALPPCVPLPARPASAPADAAAAIPAAACGDAGDSAPGADGEAPAAAGPAADQR